MHTDHLGSVSMTTSATGTVAQTQEFDPWGAVKAGGITSVSYNYTGQRLDGTGLLFYNARYYDPQLARFTSADSIVPNTSHRALTVDYHETTFNTSMRSENTQGFWFQMSDRQRQKATPSWGPDNAQELNRYSYVDNNPILYTDPSGHRKYTREQAMILHREIGILLKHVNDAINQYQDKVAIIDYVVAALSERYELLGPFVELLKTLEGTNDTIESYRDLLIDINYYISIFLDDEDALTLSLSANVLKVCWDSTGKNCYIDSTHFIIEIDDEERYRRPISDRLFGYVRDLFGFTVDIYLSQ